MTQVKGNMAQVRLTVLDGGQMEKQRKINSKQIMQRSPHPPLGVLHLKHAVREAKLENWQLGQSQSPGLTLERLE